MIPIPYIILSEVAGFILIGGYAVLIESGIDVSIMLTTHLGQALTMEENAFVAKAIKPYR